MDGGGGGGGGGGWSMDDPWIHCIHVVKYTILVWTGRGGGGGPCMVHGYIVFM